MTTTTATATRARDEPDDGRLDLIRTGRGRLRWAVVVVVVLLLAEAGARVVIADTVDEIRWYDAAAQQRVELMDERGHVDVVFAGTSAAWQAFTPAAFTDQTGLSSLNVGLAGAVPTVSGRWLTDEVDPRSTPEVVVWGLTPLDFAPEYGRLQEDAYDGAVETAGGWLASVDRSVSSVSDLVSSRRILRDPSALVGSREQERADDLAAAAAITGPDGERVDFAVDIGPRGEAIQRARLTDFEIDERDVEAILDTVAGLQAHGTRVVFVEVPVPDRFIAQLPDPAGDLDATRAAMREIGAATGSDVVFMGDVLGDTNFVDDIHVDARGAVITTDWFAEMFEVLETTTSGPTAGPCSTAEVMDRFGFVVPIDLCRYAAAR